MSVLAIIAIMMIMMGATMATNAVIAMEGDSVESCGKPASTKKSWASKGWAIAVDTGNFADSAIAAHSAFFLAWSEKGSAVATAHWPFGFLGTLYGQLTPRKPMDQRIESLLADVLDEEPDLIRDALGDLLDGFVLTVLIAVAIGSIYYGIRLVKELRRFTRR